MENEMTKRTYTLVYQAGLANVFDTTAGTSRVYQHAFTACEHFARGLREAGHTVNVAYCNRAGDIASLPWNTQYEDAPFTDGMASDFTGVEIEEEVEYD